MPTSSYLIGSIPDCSANTLRITANAVTEDIVIAAGSYYVADSNVAISAIDVLADAIASHTQISTCAVSLDDDASVSIVANIAFACVWLTGTEIMDLVGATGTLVSASSHSLPQSFFVWVPGKNEHVAKSRLGSHGWRVYDTQIAEAGTSDIIATTNNTWRENRFQWRHVSGDYVWTTAEGAGEYMQFYDVVLRMFRRFKLYRQLSFVSPSTGALWDSDGTAPAAGLGPYKMLPGRGKLMWDYDRSSGFEYVEGRNDIDLKVRQVTDY